MAGLTVNVTTHTGFLFNEEISKLMVTQIPCFAISTSNTRQKLIKMGISPRTSELPNFAFTEVTS